MSESVGEMIDRGIKEGVLKTYRRNCDLACCERKAEYEDENGWLICEWCAVGFVEGHDYAKRMKKQKGEK